MSKKQKIIYGIVLATVAGAGVISWYLATRPITPPSTPPNDGTDQTPPTSNSAKDGLDYKNIMEQMFPGRNFSPTEKTGYFSSSFNCEYATSCTYYIEQIKEGHFMNPEEDSLLVIVRRPRNELAHAGGLWRAFIAVFDKQGKIIQTNTQALAGDNGEINFYDCIQGTFILFNAGTTYQGWTSFNISLYQVKNGQFEEVWPKNEDRWQDIAIKPQKDKIIVYKRKIAKLYPESVIPDYELAPEEELYWEYNTCAFGAKKTETNATTEEIWKIYRDNKYGFELKYPDDYAIENDDYTEQERKSSLHPESLSWVWIKSKHVVADPSIHIFLIDPNYFSDIDSYIKTLFEDSPADSGKVNIDGIESVIYALGKDNFHSFFKCRGYIFHITSSSGKALIDISSNLTCGK